MEDATAETQTKGARNQALWREVNERIAELSAGLEDAEFLCECASLDCTETLQLSLTEYEDARRWPNRFPVLPGHFLPEVERVVEQNERYVVVETFGKAAEEAIRLDPRSGETDEVSENGPAASAP